MHKTRKTQTLKAELLRLELTNFFVVVNALCPTQENGPSSGGSDTNGPFGDRPLTSALRPLLDCAAHQCQNQYALFT